jgi:hypothetical protein
MCIHNDFGQVGEEKFLEIQAGEAWEDMVVPTNMIPSFFWALLVFILALAFLTLA